MNLVRLSAGVCLAEALLVDSLLTGVVLFVSKCPPPPPPPAAVNRGNCFTVTGVTDDTVRGAGI